MEKLTLVEFQNTKRKVDRNYLQKIGYPADNIPGTFAYLYAETAVIEIIDDKTYHLLVDRSDFETEDLESLELILYHWSINEFVLPKNPVHFEILSPDGFSILPEPFITDRSCYKEWLKIQMNWFINRFSNQGYYSSNEGRIALDQIESRCQVRRIN